jgi:hypothetical protein
MASRPLKTLQALEQALSPLQRKLAGIFLDSEEFHDQSSEPDHVVRLAAAILGLLLDMEAHRQKHKYRKETRQHYETYMLTMAMIERMGGEPTTTWLEWCAKNNIPEPPSPHAVMTDPPDRAPEMPEESRDSSKDSSA